MSGASDSTNAATAKAGAGDDAHSSDKGSSGSEARTQPGVLDEDDEFEDFPVDDWEDGENVEPDAATGETGAHLWEESWDDDDTSDDFAKQLQEEIKKVEGNKK